MARRFTSSSWLSTGRWGRFPVPWGYRPFAVPSRGRGMSFDVGDKVVYPHHGAAVVERRETKEVFGETRDYLVLRLPYGDLTLMVPAHTTDHVDLPYVFNYKASSTTYPALRTHS